MSRHSRIPSLTVAGFLRGVVALALTSMPAAHAYIDPGTGSMLLQMFGAAIVGGIFYFRELRLRIVAFFSRRPPAVADPGNEQPPDDHMR